MNEREERSTRNAVRYYNSTKDTDRPTEKQNEKHENAKRVKKEDTKYLVEM